MNETQHLSRAASFTNDEDVSVDVRACSTEIGTDDGWVDVEGVEYIFAGLPIDLQGVLEYISTHEDMVVLEATFGDHGKLNLFVPDEGGECECCGQEIEVDRRGEILYG